MVNKQLLIEHLSIPGHSDWTQAQQTPQQRRANERYAKQESAKRGKPDSAVKQKIQKFNPPVSKLWIGMSKVPFTCLDSSSYTIVGLLAFIICGGLIFELLRLFFWLVRGDWSSKGHLTDQDRVYQTTSWLGHPKSPVQ